MTPPLGSPESQKGDGGGQGREESGGEYDRYDEDTVSVWEDEKVLERMVVMVT